ncbi:MAG: formate dehydrogenase subunit delta [Chitinophagales bacterium]|nr:formate dehydrogenase subunit delta [Hyphomicrobiales bacterium]
MSHADRLVLMANQIGTFFISQKSCDAAAGIADHLQKFWEPRMRNAIIAIEHAGGHGLQPEVRRAVALLAISKSKLPGNPAHSDS